MAKMTFKNWEAPKGLARIGWEKACDIKLKGAKVGLIQKGFPGGYNIRFRIIKSDINEDGNPNCNWKWVTFSSAHESIDAAKQYVKELDTIIQKQLIFPTT